MPPVRTKKAQGANSAPSPRKKSSKRSGVNELMVEEHVSKKAKVSNNQESLPVLSSKKNSDILVDTTGHENCFAGLTFVFTGILKSLSREEGQDLVKRYGGKVTTAPSRKTSFVVLGDSAGPKKLQIIKENNLKTINEDGLFDLIRSLPPSGGNTELALAHQLKIQKEEAKIKADAEAMSNALNSDPIAPNSQLWTEKYAPKKIQDVCGNKGLVEKLNRWLQDWQSNLKKSFKHPGKDGTGLYRAVILSGPPGIGKTTAAHLIAHLQGYDLVEFNASDTRSKKLLEESLAGVLSSTSIAGYMSRQNQQNKKNLLIIMDEVDGMSAGDRGGVGAMAAMAKKTTIPMILICNERRLPKMRPFDRVVFDFHFRRPSSNELRARIMTIAYREGLQLTAPVVDQLAAGTHSDIRQIINLLGTFGLAEKRLDFDDSKRLTSSWEKNVILKPWDITQKILCGGMFQERNAVSLNDKIELYFNDHDFSFLMVQENYLRVKPDRIKSSDSPKRQKQTTMVCFDDAANSISEADLIDRMMHGSQQQWGLMPTHAVISFVKPAYHTSGFTTQQFAFTSWLGNNSKQGKFTRLLGEIQAHMRLSISGDRSEVRLSYLPTLIQRLGVRLARDGQSAIDDIIQLLDSYCLSKDDFDAIAELGIGPLDASIVLKSVNTQSKSAFTRKYNALSHPTATLHASTVQSIGKSQAKEMPDLEEAIDQGDEGIAEADDAQDAADDNEVTNDRFIKVPKTKGKQKKR